MTNLVDETFVRELRRALRHYYEPTKLAKSPLVGLFDLSAQEDPAQALRRILREVIDSLQPDPSTPRQTEEWLLHQVLLQRFVQQFAQLAVADDLGISERHLRRMERAAVGKLAGCLWKRYELGPKWQKLEGTSQARAGPRDTTAVGMASQDEELNWLRSSLGSQPVDIPAVLQGVLETIRPLLQAARVKIECQVPAALPSAIAETVVVRQALLSVLPSAMRSVPGGKVRVEVRTAGESLCVLVAPASLRPVTWSDEESLHVARRLVTAFGGLLELVPGEESGTPIVARLTLPTTEQVTVLVIDDNPDTLRLIRRYLSGSRYAFVGTTDSRQALSLALETRPRLIVLDVMLPQVDGWDLLGRFREHPGLRGVPVIVCSMLREEGLALALGAAAFTPKPVRRRALLSVLDEQLARLSIGGG